MCVRVLNILQLPRLGRAPSWELQGKLKLSKDPQDSLLQVCSVHRNALESYCRKTGKECANACGRKDTLWYHKRESSGDVSVDELEES